MTFLPADSEGSQNIYLWHFFWVFLGLPVGIFLAFGIGHGIFLGFVWDYLGIFLTFGIARNSLSFEKKLLNEFCLFKRTSFFSFKQKKHLAILLVTFLRWLSEPFFQDTWPPMIADEVKVTAAWITWQKILPCAIGSDFSKVLSMCIHQLQSLPTDETMDVQVGGFFVGKGDGDCGDWGKFGVPKKEDTMGFRREGEVRSENWKWG